MKSHEEFVQFVRKFNPGLEFISQYRGRKRKILVKDEFGICNVVAGSLRKNKPSIMTAIDKNAYFISQLMKVRPDFGFYDYSKIDYKGQGVDIIITCPYHGDFQQKPREHRRGRGCSVCRRENHPGGYSSVYKHNPSKETYIYLFKCTNKTEHFYKIGLSVRPQERANHIPYNIEILKMVKGQAKDLYLLEQEYHKKFRGRRLTYIPQIHFRGYTECFK